MGCRDSYHVVSIIGGVNETIMNKGQGGIPYINVSKEKQLDAIRFLNQNLWRSPKWLYEKNLISKIKKEGSLKLISNLQKSVFNRIISVKTLNRMLSTENTLEGNGLKVFDLLNMVFNSLTLEVNNPDILEREIQKNLIAQINELIKNEKLIPEVKGLIIDKKNYLIKYFKSKRKGVNSIYRIHYDYCYNFLKNE